MEVYVTSIYDSDSDRSDIRAFADKREAQEYMYSEYKNLYNRLLDTEELETPEGEFNKFAAEGVFFPGDVGEEDVYEVLQCYDRHITFTITATEVQRSLETGRNIG